LSNPWTGDWYNLIKSKLKNNSSGLTRQTGDLGYETMITKKIKKYKGLFPNKFIFKWWNWKKKSNIEMNILKKTQVYLDNLQTP
jgi:hypothetical protein